MFFPIKALSIRVVIRAGLTSLGRFNLHGITQLELLLQDFHGLVKGLHLPQALMDGLKRDLKRSLG